MEAFFWAALGFLVLAGATGGAFAGLRAWRAWQVFTSFAATAGAGAERLVTRTAELAAHSERTTARVEELSAAVARLQRALGRGRLLLGATDEAFDLLRTIRAFVPQK